MPNQRVYALNVTCCNPRADRSVAVAYMAYNDTTNTVDWCPTHLEYQQVLRELMETALLEGVVAESGLHSLADRAIKAFRNTKV